MKNLLLLKKTWLFALAALFIAGSALRAEIPDPPFAFSAYYDESGSLLFQWFAGDAEENDAAGYKIYMAEGIRNDYDSFEEIADVPAPDPDEMNIPEMMHRMEMELDNDEYSFYITAYNDDGESDPSNIIYLRKIDDPGMRIEFENMPEGIAIVNTPWTFDLDAVCLGCEPGTAIKYELMEAPATMTIDENSGELSWTPQTTGTEFVWINAYVEDMPHISGDAFFTIQVLECEEPATLSLNISSEDGDNIDGLAILYQVDEDNNIINQYFSEPGNSGYDFTVDKGTYYLLFEGFGIDPNYPVRVLEWYDDAKTMLEATAIEINCGEDLRINWTIDGGGDLEYYTVSGRVTYDDNSPVENAMVEFMSNSQGGGIWADDIYFNVMTDADGYYSAEIPGGFQYIAMAYSFTANGEYIMPVYWDQKTDPMEADLIDLDEDKRDINFILQKETNNEDYGIISGTLTNKDGEPIENGFVIAFLVSSKNSNDDWLYRGIANMVPSDGSFEFSNLAEGDYVLFAFPGSPEYAPGFYKENEAAVFSWEEATRVEVFANSAVSGIEIVLGDFDDIKGLCNLSGKVSGKELGKVNSGGQILTDESIGGASLYLLNNKGDVIKYTKSNSDGTFTMNEIPKGEYLLSIDKVGYDNCKIPVALEEDLVTVEKDIVLSSEGTTPVKEDNNIISNALVYPNPASDNFTVEFSNEANVTISVLSVSGKTLHTVSLKNRDSWTYRTDLLPNGSYIIKIDNGSNVIALPLIVVH